ncbi:hypothetical protein CEXT_402211 [Caerostris extrusa]|uniref:Uncharacterized protein n=1 Tax=Caerostris extrusa TaxID=172846 RepID=A0AAV4WMM4_CAEEX|nr:hypothetical protein CEXT_402211 [Caerostris extrusa]
MKRKFEKSKLPKKPRKADMNTKLDSILMTLLKQKNKEIKTINIGNSSKSSSSVKSSVTPKKVDFTKKYLKPHSKSNSTSTPPRKAISCEVNRPTKRGQASFNNCMETSNSHTAISKGKSLLSKRFPIKLHLKLMQHLFYRRLFQ